MLIINLYKQDGHLLTKSWILREYYITIGRIIELICIRKIEEWASLDYFIYKGIDVIGVEGSALAIHVVAEIIKKHLNKLNH